ncbi:lipocalin-like domain-containing protein [Ovoidimarina sediminis]|uniref:lipocalin-like domain-containing protein n=1 Tax=Ovoidimarina sediminis TaxID=3079856 RepID=UPI00290F32A2|nr:lipocalin-like domain-containing protein [Rhodophyticola sp. MJ-SS7]MDU8945222.1 lipocalin-like domain-containing protein [Rhodophyticola sp. MJ-SS7]
MNARRWFIRLILSLWAVSASAQVFGSIGPSADGFAQPDPAYRLSFPADHGPHPAFRIEWWYVTANLTDSDGRNYGIQWTLFRSALAPETGEGWSSPEVWMGHAAVTTPDLHLSEERFARGGIGQAGVKPEPFYAWIDEWRMEGPTLSTVRMTAQGSEFSYDLQLTADMPFVMHGDAGYSVKTPDGQASHYYSQPFYDVSGTLNLPDGPAEVTGTAWLDREWSSDELSGGFAGWDWFGLTLDGGERLMGARMRNAGGATAFSAATWIASDGTVTAFPDGAFTAAPLETTEVAGREVPVRWRIALPARGLEATVVALNDHAWMDTSFSYWEGPVFVSGSHTGRGYLEMTGYE